MSKADREFMDQMQAIFRFEAVVVDGESGRFDLQVWDVSKAVKIREIKGYPTEQAAADAALAVLQRQRGK